MKRLTDTQKTTIKDFRAAGLGYKTIAERLSLSRETVRSFCSRNNIAATPDVSTAALFAGMDGKPEMIDGALEIRQGGTVFIITTGYSERASETLKEKLEKLILGDVVKQSRSYQFVQG